MLVLNLKTGPHGRRDFLLLTEEENKSNKCAHFRKNKCTLPRHSLDVNLSFSPNSSVSVGYAALLIALHFITLIFTIHALFDLSPKNISGGNLPDFPEENTG